MPRRKQIGAVIIAAIIVYGFISDAWRVWSNFITGNISFFSVLFAVTFCVSAILNVKNLLLFKPVRDYWSVTRAMHLSMRVILITMSVFGMWLVFSSYMYNVFPNCSKWISEFEYYAWDNRFFFGTIYALMTLVTLWIAKAIFLYALTYNNLSRPQRLALIVILIFFVGTFQRILIHFVPN